MVDYALLVASELLGSPLSSACDPEPAVQRLATRTAQRLRFERGGGSGVLDPAVATNLEPCLTTRGRWGWLPGPATFPLPAKEDIASVRLPYRMRHLYFGVRALSLAKKDGRPNDESSLRSSPLQCTLRLKPKHSPNSLWLLYGNPIGQVLEEGRRWRRRAGSDQAARRGHPGSESRPRLWRSWRP